MSGPIWVLQKLWGLNSGGVETIVTEWQNNFNRDIVNFDYLLNRNQYEFYDKKISSMGSHKFSTGMLDRPYNKFIRVLHKFSYSYNFLRQSEYKIIHIHETPLHSMVDLLAAKMAGIPIRILHAHTNELSQYTFKQKILFNIIKRINSLLATQYYACSLCAAEWMFTKSIIKRGEAKVIKNGINCKKYSYSKSIREIYRVKLNIDDKFVVGFVGRLSTPKNLLFLIDVFYNIYLQNSNSVLLLVGSGELEYELKNKVNELKIEGSVIFYGSSDQIEILLQTMDVFVLPSLYEGFGIVAIEAQSASLHTFCSNGVPKDVSLTHYCHFLDLDSGASYWAREIINYNYNYERLDTNNDISKSGYDIKYVSRCLESNYLALINNL